MPASNSSFHTRIMVFSTLQIIASVVILISMGIVYFKHPDTRHMHTFYLLAILVPLLAIFTARQTFCSSECSRAHSGWISHICRQIVLWGALTLVVNIAKGKGVGQSNDMTWIMIVSLMLFGTEATLLVLGLVRMVELDAQKESSGDGVDDKSGSTQRRSSPSLSSSAGAEYFGSEMSPRSSPNLSPSLRRTSTTMNVYTLSVISEENSEDIKSNSDSHISDRRSLGSLQEYQNRDNRRSIPRHSTVLNVGH